MSQRPISLSPDLKKLRDEGHDLEIQSAFLLVKGVPYVTAAKVVKRGILAMSLTLAGDVTIRPDDHVAHFIGDYPCREDGQPIEQIRNQSGRRAIAAGVEVDHTFSAKPKPAESYENYYAKVTTYVAILSGPARLIDPSATATTFSPIAAGDDDSSPFNYLDTASSRAEIGAVTRKLEVEPVAIVGVGGTGAYVLDLIAKTPPREIHLFDGDVFLQHNAFRAPGAASLEELRAQPSKVAYLQGIYSKMRRGIVAHKESIGTENVEQLREMSFVFLCMEGGVAKRLIVERLDQYGVPFVDVGLGIDLTDNALGGILRVTTSTREKRDHVLERIPFADGEANDDYARNIQIADLNALNAALAVIRWKKACGFYRDLEGEHHCAYTIDGNTVTNDDRVS